MKFVAVFAIAAGLFAMILWRTHDSPQFAASASPAPTIGKPSAFAVSDKVSNFAPNSKAPKIKTSTASFTVRKQSSAAEPGKTRTAAGEQSPAPAIVRGVLMPGPIIAFDGLTNYDNIDAYSAVILPPDMTGDVGPNHYVQAVNALVRIYDKNGTPLTAPFKMSNLFAPLGTPCSLRNDGEPIVLYDPLADRWLLSQYCNNMPPFRQMIAVSKTADPTGAYFVYEYVMPGNKLNDFAKFGVWPDGYYMSTEEFFGADYVGAGMYAFDRTKMLAGNPSAGYIYFKRPAAVPERRSNMLPSDLDGLRPPSAGTPNIFASYTATEYGDAADAIKLFDFHADFLTPSNSTFTERPESPIAVAAFDPTSPAGRTDISQPAPGEKLDSNSDRLNYRLAYRNFGNRDSLVFNQTVRLTRVDQVYRAGVRLYELERMGSGSFAATEHSTIGDTMSSRWIGGAAQDHQGNLVIGYNHVADDKEPSILYTGRLASEPAGTFRSEAKLVEGTGVQKAFGWRWGDYNGMSVDPVDDCTFWLTGEYFTQESEDFSEFTWLTRIGTFKFPECTAAPRSTITGVITNALTSQPIEGALVKVAVYARNSSPSGSYGDLFVLPGMLVATASAHGYATQSVTLSIADGQTLVQNFALQPIPAIGSTNTQISGESCGINGSPEPGESVTIAVALQNTGALVVSDLIATPLATGGVTNPSGPQSYGSMHVNGPAVTRSFTFTVAPDVTCGSGITLTLALSDGGSPLGTVQIDLETGTPHIAFQENFNRRPQAQVPPRWMRSATNASGMPDYNRNWRISRARSTTGTRSAFSPDPNQVGLNEMVTPVFLISTPNARVTFQNWYELETTFLRNRLYDGSVMESKIGGGDWQDILVAGGIFESGGYDGTIDSCCQNPLAGRLGWSGRSGIEPTSQFITTAARLPAAAAGQRVQLRWRIGTDIGTFREGQYIDDLVVTDGVDCTCGN